MQLVGIQIYNLDIARIKNQRNESVLIFKETEFKFSAFTTELFMVNAIWYIRTLREAAYSNGSLEGLLLKLQMEVGIVHFVH